VVAGRESIAGLLIALRAKWKLREHGWYWWAVTVAIAIRIPFILYVPWSNHAYRCTALTLFGVLDFIIVWGITKLYDKLLGRT